MFKKSSNIKSLYDFLPDNHTIGTAEYYKRKFPNIPEYYCELLELESKEFTEEYKTQRRNEILEMKKIQDKKLLEELEIRKNLTNDNEQE